MNMKKNKEKLKKERKKFEISQSINQSKWQS